MRGDSPILGELVLPGDVTARPVAELAEPVRNRLGAEAGDVVLGRPGTRSASRVLSADTWRLIEQFRTPATIVAAVMGFAKDRDADPAVVLEEAAPLVAGLVNAHLLAPAGSAVAGAVEPLVAPGDLLGGRVTIVETVQVHEDVEVHRGVLEGVPPGAAVAVKVSRSPAADERIAAEAALLGRLAGHATPRLVAHGGHGERKWLAMDWVDGPGFVSWAADRVWAGRCDEVVGACVRLAERLAALHERGVVHGDLHGGNVVVAGDGEPVLLDLGGAVAGSGWSGPYRALDGHYIEPELARARLAGAGDPPPTTASEQYAFGVLAYTALTGAHPFDIPLDRDRAMRRIATSAMVPFAHQGVRRAPAVERVLARTLASDPAARYPDLHAVAAALQEAREEPAPPRGIPPALGSWWREFLGEYDTEPRADLLARDAPEASVYWGAAGIALALLSAARSSGADRLLAAASRWASFAASREDRPTAFASTALGLPDGLGARPSVFHGHVGVVLVQGLVGAQVGMESDVRTAAHALAMGLAAARDDPDERQSDPTLGPASLLWGAAPLAENTLGEATVDLAGVREAVARVLARPFPGVGEDPFLGMAHGGAGLCHAYLRAAEAFGEEPPAWLRGALDESYAATEVRSGRAWWPVRRSEPANVWAGWCHGVAGHVQLLTLAARVLGEQRWLELAVAAGEYVAAHPHREVASLCCGSAGQAAALLDLHELTGESVWFERATGFAERAAAQARVDADGRRASLFKARSGSPSRSKNRARHSRSSPGEGSRSPPGEGRGAAHARSAGPAAHREVRP